MNHFRSTSLYFSLGNVYRFLEDFENTLQLHLSSLKTRDPFYGDYSEIADSCNSLADLYIVSEKYQEATELGFKSLEIRKLVFGEQHSGIAASYDCLGNAFSGLKEYDKALEIHSLSLELKT